MNIGLSSFIKILYNFKALLKAVNTISTIIIIIILIQVQLRKYSPRLDLAIIHARWSSPSKDLHKSYVMFLTCSSSTIPKL